MYIIFLGIIFRVIFAFINSDLGPFPGLEYDAIKFHEVAVSISEDTSNMDFRTGWLYATVLGIIYKYTFDSIFFGSLISILGWLISAILIIKIIRIFKLDEFGKISLFIFSSAHIQGYYGTFQLLFIAYNNFCILKIIWKKSKYNLLFFHQ